MSLRPCEWALCGHEQGGSASSIHRSPYGGLNQPTWQLPLQDPLPPRLHSKASTQNMVGFKAYFHVLQAYQPIATTFIGKLTSQLGSYVLGRLGLLTNGWLARQISVSLQQHQSLLTHGVEVLRPLSVPFLLVTLILNLVLSENLKDIACSRRWRLSSALGIASNQLPKRKLERLLEIYEACCQFKIAKKEPKFKYHQNGLQNFPSLYGIRSNT